MTHNTFKIAALLIAVSCLPVYAQEEPTPLNPESELPVENAPAESFAGDADGLAEAAPAETVTADAPAAEAAPAAEGAVTEQAAAEAVPADGGEAAAPAEGTDPFAEPPTVDTVPVDSFASGESDPFADPFAHSSGESGGEGEEAEQSRYYLAAGFDSIDFSASSAELKTLFGGENFSGMQVHLRGGLRVHDMVSIEVQGGAKAQNGVDAGTIQINNYLGLFVVPGTSLGGKVEIAAPIGFNSFRLIRGNSKEKFQRPSFGLSLAVPVRGFKETLPDLRFTGGYKIYYVDKDARVYGYHLGMQYDFKM